MNLHGLLRRLAPAFALLLLGACAGSPQEQKLDLRSYYSVKVNSWRLKELAPGPGSPRGPLAGADAAAAGAADKARQTDAATADPLNAPVAPDAPAGPRKIEVYFDLQVTHRGTENLPGLTFDVTQIDPFRQVKKTYRPYLELPPKMYNGETGEFELTFVADNFVDGDVFNLVLAEEVAPADRGAYRELQ